MNNRIKHMLTLASNLTPDELSQFIDSLNLNRDASFDIALSDRTKNGVKCPHCGSTASSRNGKSNGHQRYICSTCHKSFMESTRSIFASKKISNFQVKSIFSCMVKGLSIRHTADEVGVDKNTAFLWRHKILDAISTEVEHLSGIVEADETFFGISYKGSHKMPRQAKHRGEPASFRGLSHEQICVPCGLDRSGHAISKIACTGRVSSKALGKVFGGFIEADSTLITDKMNSYTRFAHHENLHLVQLKPEHGKAVVKGVYHIQNINSYHSGLKKFMRQFNGVSTKYLNNYLSWYKWLRCNKDSFGKKSETLLCQTIAIYSTTHRDTLSFRPMLPVAA